MSFGHFYTRLEEWMLLAVGVILGVAIGTVCTIEALAHRGCEEICPNAPLTFHEREHRLDR